MNDHDTVGPSDDEEPRGQPSGPPPARSSGRRWIVSVFGDITRTGSWPPGRTTSPVAVFGDIDLDLRQATMPPGEVVINAVAPFGNIDVLVPEGAQVDVGGFTLFGSKKVAVGDATTNESAPVIRVRGFSLFGSVKVWSS
jgi:Cell wall-active antibiotics response 4TMS YvqF